LIKSDIAQKAADGRGEGVCLPPFEGLRPGAIGEAQATAGDRHTHPNGRWKPEDRRGETRGGRHEHCGDQASGDPPDDRPPPRRPRLLTLYAGRSRRSPLQREEDESDERDDHEKGDRACVVIPT
jgi:hypothetical protein